VKPALAAHFGEHQRLLARLVVNIHQAAISADAVLKFSTSQHILPRDGVLAHDATAISNADGLSGDREIRIFIARYVFSIEDRHTVGEVPHRQRRSRQLDPVGRVEYLLAIEGARKEGEHKQQAPPELLEEVFELNESLDELREAKAYGGDLAALKSRLESAEKGFQQKLGEVDAQLQAAAKEWDAALQADSATRKKVMAKLNELLNRRSYIRNLVANVQKELL